MAIKTEVWDAAQHLDSEEKIAAYLEAAFAEGDAELIVAALGDVAKARGMTAIANEAHITRQALYKALGPKGNPTLSTLLPVLKALGVRLNVEPAGRGASVPRL